jgi:hypothetical protein
MAYIAPTTKSTGTLITAAIWNADVVANEIAIYAGGLSIASQAIGDILYASSTTQFARVAAVAAGQILASAGTGTVPAYSATPALTSVDMGGTTVYGSRAITVDTGGVLNVVLASAAGDDFTVDTDKLVVSGDTGAVGIGTAAPVSLLDIRQATGTNYIKIADTRSTTGDSAGVLMGTGGGGAAKSLVAHIETGANGIGDMVFAVDAANDENDAVLADEKMRITSAGNLSLAAGQITFPATQVPSTDANTLDDYEEGSWTPVLGGQDGTSGQGYTDMLDGRYVKIGKVVTITFHFKMTTEGTITGDCQIQGLPFTARTIGGGPGVCNAGLAWSGTTTSYVNIRSQVYSNSTVAGIAGMTGAATSQTALTASNVQDNTVFSGMYVYETSA